MHGYARGTHDVDFLTTDLTVLDVAWNREIGIDAIVDVRRGDPDDPLAGVVRISRGTALPVDVIAGRWAWQRDVIERSVRRDLGVFEAPVPSAEDLVILKIDAGGPLDQRDAAQLLEIHGADLVGAVDARMRELPESLQAAWAELRRAFGI